MSCDFGFAPSDKPNYFFISYNSEDINRIIPLAKGLFHRNVPIWYDRGLEYGEKWEEQISKRIRDAQALLLFFTKNILYKSNSYVRKEYEMAVRFFNKKVYVIMLDKIENHEVPYDKVPWWIDIQEKQSIDVTKLVDTDETIDTIQQAIGMATYEDRMHQLIQKYKILYDEGRINDAEAYLLEYMHGQSLAGKACLIASIYLGKLKGILNAHIKRETSKKELSNELYGVPIDYHQIVVFDCMYTIANHFVFHRGKLGDAHVLHVFKNNEKIHTVHGLVEAYDLCEYYDENDDVLYVCYKHEKEIIEKGELIDSEKCIGVTIIENCQSCAVCTDFFDVQI